MKRKILLYYLIIVIIAISATAFLVSEHSKELYRQEVEQSLRSEASMMDFQMSERVSKGETIDYNAEAASYAQLLAANTRVTFIQDTGVVVGESQADFRSMENHKYRKEFKEAISGGTGTDIRYSKTLGVDFLYVARRMDSSDTVIRLAVPLVQLEAINRGIWSYAFLGMLAGLVIAMLLALKFTSSIINPLKEFIAVSKDIANGNYKRQVTIKSKDELGQLALTYNEMAGRLDSTIADLKDKNLKFDSIMNSMTNGFVAVDKAFRIILINNIACDLLGIRGENGNTDESEFIGKNFMEVIRSNQVYGLLKQVIESNTPSVSEIAMKTPDERIFRIYSGPIKPASDSSVNSGGILSIIDVTNVKKLEQIRTEFVSNVTHELKTPLTSIRGFVETLREGAVDDPEVAGKFLDIIDIEAERLTMLINDILNLSEIESAQHDTNIGTHSLLDIVSETVSILEGTAEKKNIKIMLEIESSVKITANRDRIKQLFINLIDNAIKYNTEGGSVTVRAANTGGRTVISVKDTGIGIAREHLSRIFERFYRVDKGRSRSMGGTGLGLSIVKHIVNLYSGDISVESIPGRGTEFTIQLPG
ncbi:MAG: cell wall metabolism sensor histidine kinase WalK [Clostridiales bacterium]|nr:cell wall metabolism sensor histidine kinase WalK [Clostridiales bacterium]